MKPLPFPVDVPSRPRFSILGFPHAEMTARFGPRHEFIERDHSVSGPTEFWAFELQDRTPVVLEYVLDADPKKTLLNVCTTADDAEAVARALGLPLEGWALQW